MVRRRIKKREGEVDNSYVWMGKEERGVGGEREVKIKEVKDKKGRVRGEIKEKNKNIISVLIDSKFNGFRLYCM